MKIVSTIFLLGLFTISLHAQNFVEQEPFHLINIGNGAAALGLAGAYIAIADDLSAFNWNPAGLSTKTGFRIQFDSVYTTGSENFEVTTLRSGTTQHDFSVSGFQPQTVALTYQFERDDVIFGPAFAWNRSTLSLHDYKMDAAATGHFNTPDFFISADYSEIYNRTYDRGGEDIYSFGFLFKKNSLAIGTTWNFLSGESTQTLVTHQTQNGTRLFYPSDEEPVIAPFSLIFDVTRHLNGKYSGSYLNVGILYEQNRKISIGGSVRFGYTRTVDTIQSNAVDFVLSGLVPFSDHRISELDPSTLEFKIPIEFSGGIAIRLTSRLLAASSLTFADYRMKESSLGNALFPTQRERTTFQSTLIQWRNGLEFQGNHYLKIRGGFIIDDQPYSLEYYPLNKPDDAPFYGFTLGAGWSFQKMGFDVAFLHETGRGLFGVRLGGILDHDVEFSDGRLSHNRLFFTVKFNP